MWPCPGTSKPSKIGYQWVSVHVKIIVTLGMNKMAAEQTQANRMHNTATMYAPLWMKNTERTNDTGAPVPISRTADNIETMTYLESLT